MQLTIKRDCGLQLAMLEEGKKKSCSRSVMMKKDEEMRCLRSRNVNKAVTLEWELAGR